VRLPETAYRWRRIKLTFIEFLLYRLYKKVPAEQQCDLCDVWRDVLLFRDKYYPEEMP